MLFAQLPDFCLYETLGSNCLHRYRCQWFGPCQPPWAVQARWSLSLHGKKSHPLLTWECRLGTGEVCRTCMGYSHWVLSVTSQCCLALANCPRAPGTSWLPRGCGDLPLVLDQLLLRQDQYDLSPALGTWQGVQGHWPGGPCSGVWRARGRAFLSIWEAFMLVGGGRQLAHPCIQHSSSSVTRSRHVYLIEPALCLDGGELPTPAL